MRKFDDMVPSMIVLARLVARDAAIRAKCAEPLFCRSSYKACHGDLVRRKDAGRHSTPMSDMFVARVIEFIDEVLEATDHDVRLHYEPNEQRKPAFNELDCRLSGL